MFQGVSMAIRSFLAYAIFLLAACPAFAAPKFPYTAEAINDRVNIRAGQNNNFEIVATLNKGDRMIVTAKSYSWFKVRLPDGAKAFVKSEYLKLVTPEVGEILADRVNVRAAPNTNATILGQVVKGNQLFVKEVRPDGWIWVKPVNELAGWVHESLIAFKSNQILPIEKEPVSVTAKKVIETKAAEAKPVVKPILITKLPNGFVACTGKLIKVEGALSVYQVFREGQIVCVVDGPTDALSRFENKNVTVQGKVKENTSPAEAPTLVLSKVYLSLQ
jgi:uncharacterized protein YgiM (DUF1202 family)